MPVTTSLKPIGPHEFGRAQAKHLLNRAGFGGTPKQIEAIAAMGPAKAVDYLVDFQAIDDSDLEPPGADPDIMHPPNEEDRMKIAKARREGDLAVKDLFRAEYLMRQGRDRRQMGTLERWWLARMIATPRPMEERLTLLWHNHFATNHRTVDDSYLMLRQNEFFRANANGSFAELAAGIVRDPAMIKFLNNDSNRKAKPNENLARELMELFTLGEGNYSEDDIKEGAGALTGYHFDDNDFVFRRKQHDEGRKEILGQAGRYDGDGFVRILLEHPACSVFVVYKLYKEFVGDVDDKPTAEQRSVIVQTAQLLRETRYGLRPVLKTLLLSKHFHDPGVMGNKLKSPAQFVAGSVRILGTPVRDVGLLTDAMTMMGQKLFDPPSVAGWSGGRSWINTSTLFVRQNTCTYLLTGKLPFEDGWSSQRINYDPMFLLEGVEPTPEKTVDHLLATLIAVDVTAERRDGLVSFMKARSKGVNAETVLGLLLLITAMPEYQLC